MFCTAGKPVSTIRDLFANLVTKHSTVIQTPTANRVIRNAKGHYFIVQAQGRRIFLGKSFTFIYTYNPDTPEKERARMLRYGTINSMARYFDLFEIGMHMSGQKAALSHYHKVTTSDILPPMFEAMLNDSTFLAH